MVDFDSAFAAALERAILKALNGDKDTQGLYQSIRGAQNWDMFQRINGTIAGYEAVLGEMHKIARYMNALTERDNDTPQMRPIN